MTELALDALERAMNGERALVHVYVLPNALDAGFCFQPKPIMFYNVDWFEHLLALGRPALEAFIKGKRYYHPTIDLLVISEHPDLTFRIPATDTSWKIQRVAPPADGAAA